MKDGLAKARARILYAHITPIKLCDQVRVTNKASLFCHLNGTVTGIANDPHGEKFRVRFKNPDNSNDYVEIDFFEFELEIITP